jgi:glycerol-3-phosphate dehydrogenase
MQSLSATGRSQHLSTLASTYFDVLVIGGGVTGAGVALDAAARGYKVALVEKADFASSTSSKSTKLVHGGIRYLPNFDFALVHEALTERSILLHIAPFLVKPVGFVLPVYEGERHPVGLPISPPGGVGLSLIMNVGLWLYDSMAGQRSVHRHRHLRRDDVEKLAPALLTHGLKDGFIYYDAQTNDARLTMTLIQTAAQFGATVVNYAEVTSFVIEHGKVCGARIHEQLGNQEITVRARHIVNATGIYTERVERMLGEESQVQIDPSKGVHLVLSREALKMGDYAIVLPETDDKRILFIVPWQSRVIFGTTDTGSGDLDHPVATKEDVAYLLNHLNRYLSVRITEADIISAYAGYRPLVQSRTSVHSTARLSRTHTVLQSPSGLVSIVGGKLTTYRRMAQDTVDVLCLRDGAKPQHVTQNIPLFGSGGWPSTQHELEVKGSLLGLSPQTITHLGWSYGSEATRVLSLIEGDTLLSGLLVDDLPYIRAEVVHGCRHEMAMTPYDVLARRTSITLEDRQRGLGCVEDVADLMAKEHGWSAGQRRSMVDAYRNAIEQQMAAEKAS